MGNTKKITYCARCGDQLFNDDDAYMCDHCGKYYCEFDGELTIDENEGEPYQCHECCVGNLKRIEINT